VVNLNVWNAEETNLPDGSWDGRKHLLLEAHAGTGKTYSLVRIIRRWLEMGIGLNQILVMTFTEKAAREMRTRLRSLLLESPDTHLQNIAQDIPSARITTIHGFCNWVLEHYPASLGVRPHSQLMDSTEIARLVVTRFLRQQPLEFDGEPGFAKTLLKKNYLEKAVEMIRNNILDPKKKAVLEDENLTTEQIIFHQILTYYYENKDSFLKEKGWMTFDSMLSMTREGLKNQPSLVKKLKGRFLACIVDEFQDTDELQWEIISSLFPGDDSRPLVLIGDPKQSIYAFRGADLRLYSRVKTLIPIRASLTTNYRTVPELLEPVNVLSDRIFSFNGAEGWGKIEYTPETYSKPAPKNKVTWKVPDAEGVVFLGDLKNRPKGNLPHHRDAFRLEVSKEIMCLKGRSVLAADETGQTKERLLGWGDFAVLCSKNSDAKLFIRDLKRAGIPAVWLGMGNLWEGNEAKAVRFLLRYLEKSHEPERARLLLLDLWSGNSPKDVAGTTFLPPELQASLSEGLRLVRVGNFSGLASWVLGWSPGWITNLLSQRLGYRYYTNILHILEKLERAYQNGEMGSRPPSLWLEGKMSGTAPESEREALHLEYSGQAVRVMTVHSSKGLEFPVVFLSMGYKDYSGITISKDDYFTLASGEHSNKNPVWLTQNHSKNKVELQKESWLEACRLWYVGLTRAQLKLYLPAFLPSATDRRSKLWEMDWLYKSLMKKPATDGAPDKKSDDWKFRLSQSEELFSSSEFLEIKQTVRSSTQDVTESSENKPSIFKVLAPEKNRKSWSSNRLIQSFSSLKWGNEEVEVIHREKKDPLFFGPRFGTLFHTAMEVIPWDSNLTETLTENWIETQGYSPDEAKKLLPEILNLVRLTLETPLINVDNLTLQKLGNGPLTMERTFLRTSDIPSNQGYLKGVIDLIFQYRDNVYILDYKTNALESYNQESMKAAMESHHYTTQAQFYGTTVTKVLQQQSGLRYRGALYLFVRGLGANGAGQFWMEASNG